MPRKILKTAGVFTLAFLWLLTGLGRVYITPKVIFPPKIREARAAIGYNAAVGTTGTAKTSTANLTHAANVMIIINVAYAGTTSPSSVTVGGVNATSLSKVSQSTNVSAQMFYYFDTAAATDAVTVTFAANTRHAWNAASYTGVKSTSSFEGTATNSGTGASAQTSTVTVAIGTAGRVIVSGVAAIDSATGTGSITAAPANGETQRGTTSALAGTSSTKSVSSEIEEFSNSAAHAMNATLTKSGRTIQWATVGTALLAITVPTVTTQAATSIKDITATANGNITDIGGENADKEGFVYDTATKTLPGNVAPGASGYASFTENTGSFGTGAFTVSLTGLTGGVTYYGRAYAHNSSGYSYGGEVSFTTGIVSISITTNGTISYGYLAAGGQKDTTASSLNNTQTAQNNGTLVENFNIKTSNTTGGVTWTLGSTSGADIFVHEFSVNSGGAWTKFTTADSYQSLATGVASNGNQSFDLRITGPSSSSDYQQKTITVTVQAVAQ